MGVETVKKCEIFQFYSDDNILGYCFIHFSIEKTHIDELKRKIIFRCRKNSILIKEGYPKLW